MIGQQVIVTHQGQVWGGTLDFVGINPLHGQFQITVGRVPLWGFGLSIKDIKPC